MQEEELKEALAKLFASDANSYEERTFFFPRVGDASYKIVGGMSGKELMKYIAPCMIIAIIIMLIPPYSSLVLWIIKLFLFAIFLTIGVLFALLRPISVRPNIRLSDYLKNEIDFLKRQKVFILAKKKNKYEGVEYGKENK